MGSRLPAYARCTRETASGRVVAGTLHRHPWVAAVSCYRCAIGETATKKYNVGKLQDSSREFLPIFWLGAKPRPRGSMNRVICSLSVVFALMAFSNAQTPTTAIKVDQVGYLSASPKLALVSTPGTTFTLRRASDDATIFEGKLSPPTADQDTGDTVQAADFSSVTTAGEYYLEIPGVGRSWHFHIGPDVYARPFYLVMRGFYGQRCGVEVDMGPEFPNY